VKFSPVKGVSGECLQVRSAKGAFMKLRYLFLASGDVNVNGVAPDIKGMAGDIAKLSKMDFEKESKELEKKLVPLLNVEDQGRLRKSIDEALL
jgi:hypothetical protein